LNRLFHISVENGECFQGASVVPVSGMTGEPAVKTARPRNYRLAAALFARRRIVSARLNNTAGLVAVAAVQAGGLVLTIHTPASGDLKGLVTGGASPLLLAGREGSGGLATFEAEVVEVAFEHRMGLECVDIRTF
jgi:hypothetical protein